MQNAGGTKIYLTVGARTMSNDYSITTTTNISYASMNWFFDTEGRLYNLNYGSRYYLTYVPATAYAAAQTVLSYYSRGEYPKREAAGPSFTPQNFTLKIYDKTGTTVERTENVSATNSNGTVSIDGLNNGLRTHICLIWRVSQDDDAGGVIAKGGYIGLDESLR